ncbi:dihydrofolate reductase [Lactobacillus sp. PSON]|uniref:dihydrofolate reductase n=1 Tax=Lactobacillus sp. PSON TaxID=3455454 RepID=UPI004042EE03
MITFVWAEDKKHQIGYQGHLPWFLPADLKYFKKETMGHPILMGRKTFDSLPRVLPGRLHLVLTRSQEFKDKYRDNQQVIVFLNQEELFTYLKKHQNEDICAIGGVSIFKILRDKVDCLKRTVIDASFKADTEMPQIDYSQFNLVKEENHEADNKNEYAYSFLTYVRKDKDHG